MAAEPVKILASELHLMQSNNSGRDYRITISLPLGYGKAPDEPWPFNDTPALWPVVYVLDGNWYAGLVTDIIRPMAWCGSTTDAIVVGIGYPELDTPIASFRSSFTRRDHDLTPIFDASAQRFEDDDPNRPLPNGDAAGFHKFMRDELLPFIEKTYRADPARRILAGHSYGGLFALYALFENPGLYHTLVVGSPTMSYGNRYMFQREEAYAKENKRLPARIYMFAAENEEFLDDTTLTDTLRFAAILAARNYDGLTLVKHVFEDQNHCEVAAPGLQAGVKFALKK
jgi:uncharacterized protein